MKALFKYLNAVFIVAIILVFVGLTVFTQNANAQPINDECVDSIEVFDGVNPYDNINATNSSPAWTCAAGGSDVWFEYTATCTGDIVFETCNNGALPETNYDSAIEIFDTGVCANVDIAAVLCNDDACGLQSSLVVMSAVEGDTYLIRLGGFAGFQGEGHLEIIPQENCIPIEPIEPKNVPTLSEWGLIAMAGILGIVGFMVLRRRKATA